MFQPHLRDEKQTNLGRVQRAGREGGGPGRLRLRPHPFGPLSLARAPPRQTKEQCAHVHSFPSLPLLFRLHSGPWGRTLLQAQNKHTFGWDGCSRSSRSLSTLEPGRRAGWAPWGAPPSTGPAHVWLTWLACPGPWAASRALYSPSDISTRKPVTPSRGCAPWISGSAMIGLDLAALQEESGESCAQKGPGARQCHKAPECACARSQAEEVPGDSIHKSQVWKCPGSPGEVR